MLNEQTINGAYGELADATTEYRRVESDHLQMKALLDADIAKALASGEIVGKNETERHAAARERFAAQFVNLELLDHARRHARLRHELAGIEVERVRSLLRLMEVTGAVQVKTQNDGENDNIPF